MFPPIQLIVMIVVVVISFWSVNRPSCVNKGHTQQNQYQSFHDQLLLESLKENWKPKNSLLFFYNALWIGYQKADKMYNKWLICIQQQIGVLFVHVILKANASLIVESLNNRRNLSPHDL